QTDFDGKFTYSDVKVIDYEGPRFAALKVYPNPSKGDNLTVVIAGLKDQTSVPVRIYNIQGQLIYDGVFEVDNPGTIKRELEFGNRLKSGVYIIRAGQTLQLTQKFFVD
ncbi:MAG TPA: T9SS type A sorting domain-containing protein, partial [Chryseolinea sp.]|nr:T9SS type A sorting domain-containing protein [Chryseolinea sp.]